MIDRCLGGGTSPLLLLFFFFLFAALLTKGIRVLQCARCFWSLLGWIVSFEKSCKCNDASAV